MTTEQREFSIIYTYMHSNKCIQFDIQTKPNATLNLFLTNVKKSECLRLINFVLRFITLVFLTLIIVYYILPKVT